MGKEKIQGFGALSHRLVFAAFYAVLMAPIASCSSGPTLTYTGMLVPQAGACDEGTRAVLLRKRSQVQFVPSDGVIILEGTFSGTDFAASRQLLDMNHVPYSVRFTGQLNGDHVVGIYVTKRCRYGIDLALARN